MERRDNVPSSGRLSGSTKSLPVCSTWHHYSVACCGGEGRALLLAAADGRGTAGCRDGRYYQMHPQRRVEMVIFNLDFVLFLSRMFNC